MKKMKLLEEANHVIELVDLYMAVGLEIIEKEDEGILIG